MRLLVLVPARNFTGRRFLLPWGGGGWNNDIEIPRGAVKSPPEFGTFLGSGGSSFKSLGRPGVGSPLECAFVHRQTRLSRVKATGGLNRKIKIHSLLAGWFVGRLPCRKSYAQGSSLPRIPQYSQHNWIAAYQDQDTITIPLKNDRSDKGTYQPCRHVEQTAKATASHEWVSCYSCNEALIKQGPLSLYVELDAEILSRPLKNFAYIDICQVWSHLLLIRKIEGPLLNRLVHIQLVT